jgi:hypothetical protein
MGVRPRRLVFAGSDRSVGVPLLLHCCVRHPCVGPWSCECTLVPGVHRRGDCEGKKTRDGDEMTLSRGLPFDRNTCVCRLSPAWTYACVCPNTQLGSLPNAAAATGTRCVWPTRCACRTGPARLMQVPVCCALALRLAQLAASLLIGRLHVLYWLDLRQLWVACHLVACYVVACYLVATTLQPRSAEATKFLPPAARPGLCFLVPVLKCRRRTDQMGRRWMASRADNRVQGSLAQLCKQAFQ